MKMEMQYELNKQWFYDKDGEVIGEDNFVVPADWLLKFWESNKDKFVMQSDDFESFLDIYEPETDGKMIFDAACRDGVLKMDEFVGRL